MVEIVPLQSVSLNSYLSRKCLHRQGAPYWLPLPSSLLVINGLVVELPRGVKAVLYVNNADVPGHGDEMAENAKRAITLAITRVMDNRIYRWLYFCSYKNMDELVFSSITSPEE